MKKSLHKKIVRTLLVLACVLTASSAWAATWTVTGSAALCVSEWDVTDTNNDMTLVDGLYTWTMQRVLLHPNADDNPRFKICKDHAWGESYPSEDYKCWVNGGATESRYYNVTITFNETTHDIGFITTPLPDEYTVAGTTNNSASGSNDDVFGISWNAIVNVMNTSDNEIYTWTSSETRLDKNGIVTFKVVKNATYWLGDDGTTSGSNIERQAPEDGVYILTVTYTIGDAPVATLTQVPAIAHDASNFPDDNFRNSLSAAFPEETADGYWTPAELASVTSIDCKNSSISTLKGIENFTALTSLDCSGNKLTSIDLTNNTALTSTNLNGQSVTFNNIVKSLTYENRIYYFIWLNNQYNGQDPWFVGAIQQLDGMGAQSQFDLNRVTWGEGCQEFTGTVQNNTSNSIGLQALSDGLPADIIAGKVLLVSGNADEGTFKYNYAATGASKDGSSMEVTVNWTGASVPTGIDIIGAGEIKATRYYNLMGVESATPFQGVNIIVKEYSDGTRDTSKVIMK